jgi:hypothetical protein
MKNKSLALILLLLCFSLNLVGQDFEIADTLRFDNIVFQGGTDLMTGYRENRECGKAYVFNNSIDSSIVFNQFGGQLKRNIAILGLSNFCICIGDSVSIVLYPSETDCLDPTNTVFGWLKKWGILERNGQFTPKRRYGKRFLKRHYWFQSNVVFRNRAYLIEVIDHKKIYIHHGDFGDNCGSCQEGNGVN